MSGIDGVVAYQDDVIVFANYQMINIQRLSAILDRFIQNNARINDEECKFGVDRINCVGFVLDNNRIKPNPERLVPLLRAIERQPATFGCWRYAVLFKVYS